MGPYLYAPRRGCRALPVTERHRQVTTFPKVKMDPQMKISNDGTDGTKALLSTYASQTTPLVAPRAPECTSRLYKRPSQRLEMQPPRQKKKRVPRRCTIDVRFWVDGSGLPEPPLRSDTKAHVARFCSIELWHIDTFFFMRHKYVGVIKGTYNREQLDQRDVRLCLQEAPGGHNSPKTESGNGIWNPPNRWLHFPMRFCGIDSPIQRGRQTALEKPLCHRHS